MKEIEGDLIELMSYDIFDVVVHGCNCFNTMNSGIAKQMREYYPQSYAADLRTVKGDVKKLGTISTANHYSQVIVNAYTQYAYGRTGIYVDYFAIADCFREIKKRYSGKRIGIPLIGCGLAGGDWDIVSNTINDIMIGEDVTLVRFNKG